MRLEKSRNIFVYFIFTKISVSIISFKEEPISDKPFTSDINDKRPENIKNPLVNQVSLIGMRLQTKFLPKLLFHFKVLTQLFNV